VPNGDEAYEDYPDEAYDDYGEAAPRRLRPIATARPQPLPPRPAERPVTQAQLQMAVNRLNADISRNSTAIQRVNSNVTTLGRDIRRQSSQVRNARNDIGTLRDAVVLEPVLATAFAGTSNPTLAALLPLLLVSGIGQNGQAGGGTSGGLFGGGGDSTTTLLLVLALSGVFKG
jgi:hypothetical protein